MLIRQHVYRVIAGFNNTEHSTEHSYGLYVFYCCSSEQCRHFSVVKFHSSAYNLSARVVTKFY